MKLETSDVDESGAEKIVSSDVIQVDVEPPATLFSFQAPEGYEVTTVKEAKVAKNGVKLFPVAQAGSGSTWLASWHSFNINERAVLACWFQHDITEGEKLPFARPPEFELYSGCLLYSSDAADEG